MKDSQPFAVSFYVTDGSTDYLMASDTGSAFVSAGNLSPGPIADFTIEATGSQFVREVTPVTITFRLGTNLPASSEI
jgi:hypothetical protein